jgi:cell wall-associated NlpC family hydrolase
VSDWRLTPANGRVALTSLRGTVTADRYVDGTWHRVGVALADLCREPGGARDRQVLMGERVLLLEDRGGHAFVQAEKDGYCGYLRRDALTGDGTATHWVSAPATVLFSAPDLKSPERAVLSLGARLTIAATHARFLETEDGLFVPRRHLRSLGDWEDDPAAVAERLLGSPYLWGGNSRAGIDCSGLVQAALLACGRPCPGDSDLQWQGAGDLLPPDAAQRRGDLLFWQGHVAIAVDDRRIIHANGFQMAVGYEDAEAALARIAAQGEGPLLGRRRP